MKKIAAVLFLIIFLLTACTPPQPVQTHEKLNIVTSNFPTYDLVRRVCGDMVSITMLLPPGVDAHSFEPSPAEIIKIQEADLFIYTGGESDEWIEKIKKGINTSDNKFLSLIDKVSLISQGHNHSVEPHHSEYDEHIWTSLSNAKVLTNVITSEICKIEPKNEQLYKLNAEAHIKDIEKLEERIWGIVENSKRKTLIFADRFPFLYFANEFGLSFKAAFPGCSSEAEPSASTVAELIDVVQSESIPYIFYVEMSNKKIAATISSATNAKTLMMHSCHTITKDEFLAGETYISLMTKNADNLEKALN